MRPEILRVLTNVCRYSFCRHAADAHVACCRECGADCHACMMNGTKPYTHDFIPLELELSQFAVPDEDNDAEVDLREIDAWCEEEEAQW